MNILRKKILQPLSCPLLSKNMEYSFSTKDTDVSTILDTFFEINDKAMEARTNYILSKLYPENVI
jgi:hypothetical protein